MEDTKQILKALLGLVTVVKGLSTEMETLTARVNRTLDRFEHPADYSRGDRHHHHKTATELEFQKSQLNRLIEQETNQARTMKTMLGASELLDLGKGEGWNKPE